MYEREYFSIDMGYSFISAFVEGSIGYPKEKELTWRACLLPELAVEVFERRWIGLDYYYSKIVHFKKRLKAIDWKDVSLFQIFWKLVFSKLRFYIFNT